MNIKVFMILFVLAAVILLLLGHTGLFFSWLNFFHITLEKTKVVFAVVMGILAISFIVTTALTFWKDNAIVDALYTGASVWLGFALYATIATGLGWLLIGLLQRSDRPIGLQLALGALLLCAAGYTAYGVWNAQHPILKNVTVTIPGLPDEWKGATVVQLSDIHLGPIQKQPFLNKVVRETNNLQPDLVMITGDLFDGEGSHLDNLAAPLQNLTARKGVYFITGNHESYIGVEKSLHALDGLPLTILRDEVATIDGLQILGVDYQQAGQKKDVTPVLAQLDAGMPSIILYHEPTHLDEFSQAGGNLLLSGHTHQGQLWPFNWITKSIFKGYDYGLKKKDDMWVYTSSGIGTWGPPIRTDNHPEIVVITLQ